MKSTLSHSEYDESFKREVARPVVEEGPSAYSVERDLGISNGSIFHWRKALAERPESKAELT